ncbi:MAG: class IV adenylate cyclase [Spirochaetes bacterium]|nr:class IV adenylate cyclase [Spirochaetota bacterium]
MLEIELKARIGDPAHVKRILDANLVYAGEVDKKDEYWFVPLADAVVAGLDFRLRMRTEPGKTTVTFKEKTYDGSVEINREVEFGILDPEAFRLFLGKMSAKLIYRKTKRGKVWKDRGGIVAELVEVDGLGTFLEVETLYEDSKSIDLEDVKAGLQAVIASCGLGEKDLEPRPYSQLLGMYRY